MERNCRNEVSAPAIYASLSNTPLFPTKFLRFPSGGCCDDCDRFYAGLGGSKRARLESKIGLRTQDSKEDMAAGAQDNDSRGLFTVESATKQTADLQDMKVLGAFSTQPTLGPCELV